MNPVSARTSEDPAPLSGRQRLIDAALRLAARDGITLSALGLRELAREAGLNHNTFYRHFDRPEELGEAAAEEIAAQIMAGMGEVRRRAERHRDATIGAVEYFIDFVLANPDVFHVGIRELHSASSPMRPVLLRVLDAIAKASVEQIRERKLVPIDDTALLFEVALDITRYLFAASLEIIERPKARKALALRYVAHIRRQFIGAIASRQGG